MKNMKMGKIGRPALSCLLLATPTLSIIPVIPDDLLPHHAEHADPQDVAGMGVRWDGEVHDVDLDQLTDSPDPNDFPYANFQIYEI